jgi:asparagine synthase (glutamine-hydrolysing)
MSRRSFIALSWCGDDAGAAGRASDIGSRLAAEGWRARASAEGLAVWARDAVWPRIRVIGAGVVIGNVHRRAGSALWAPEGDDAAPPDPDVFARRLAAEAWGAYVALLRSPGGGPAEVFRDPGGALGCVAWSLGDRLHVVTDDLATVPGWLRPRRQSLDWNRIAAVLATPTAGTTEPLFDDMTGVGPGQRLTLGAKPSRTPIWTPCAFAREDSADLRWVEAELVRRVDNVVATLLAPHDRVVMELSGGLDSSIVAGAIGATALTDRVAHWLNYRDGRPEANEARFARAVTARLGVALHEQAKTFEPLDEAALKEIGAFSRPAIGAMDGMRDRFETELLRASGATAIVSGQGGDGVFFQYPTALVAADEFARRGWGAWRSPVVADVARRTRQSVWSVVRQVQAAKRGRETRPSGTSALLTRGWAEAARGIEHEWVTAARRAGLPPGKVLHVEGIAVTHFFYEPSRRLAVADLLTPLFTQPVMELCLSVPVPDLAGGSYDRPFARRAFADRLPPAVLNRRAKGALTVHVARRVAASCDVLRPYLIDGCLAEAGLLDRRKLRHTLDPERLMSGQAQHAMHVLNAAAVEAWVRHWQGQVPDSRSAGRR